MPRQYDGIIPKYLSIKNTGRVMDKLCKAKLSARGLEAVNLFLDLVLIHIVKHRSVSGNYTINHYQNIFKKLIKDRELLRRCCDDAKSRSAQMITGLSLDYVLSIQEPTKDSRKADIDTGDDPHYKARYLSQMRTFITSSGLLGSKHSSPSGDRPVTHLFSVPVGLFITNAFEQLSKFVLSHIGTTAKSEKLSTISADRVAFIFYHSPLVKDIASSVSFFQSFEVKTFKAVAIDDSNMPSLLQTEGILPDHLLLFQNNQSSDWEVNSASYRSPTMIASEKYSPGGSRASFGDDNDTMSSLSNHLSTNLSLSNDRTKDFEQLFNSGRTVKLSLTPSRLRAVGDYTPPPSPIKPMPTTRRRSIMSQTSTLFTKGI